ncbi:uncharacterized protein [Linepithema humile]|uniref:uncharacterized protein n=1 Tax=Linepithema humile TaxID=83485 RepID=UPI00351DDD8E
MSSSWNILDEIEILLADEPAPRPTPRSMPKPIPKPTPPTPTTPSSPARVVPRVGTTIQRSDRQQQRKAAFLASPPLPPTKGRKRGPPDATCTITHTAPQERKPTRPTAVPTTALPEPAAATARRPSWAVETRPSTAVAAPPTPPAAAPRPLPAAARPSPTVARPPPVATQPVPAATRPPPAAAPPAPPIWRAPDPPPVMVEFAPGEFAAIPHWSVVVSRGYKLRTADGRRYKLRFSRDGRLIKSRQQPPQAPTPENRGVM